MGKIGIGLKFWILLGLGVISIPLQSQNAQSKASKFTRYQIQVVCDQRGLDNEMLHLLDVLPLFELNAAVVAQPIDMSADYPGQQLKYYPIKLPKQFYVQPSQTDTRSGNDAEAKLIPNLTYGFAQHSHMQGDLPHHTLIVVERPQVLRYRKSRVWVDLNHNLDLSDDSAQFFSPSSTPFSQPVVPYEESLLRLEDRNQGVSVQLGFFMSSELRSYQKLYADAIELIRGDRKFVGVSSSFRQRRMTVLWGSSIVYGGDTLHWALKDVNLNGRYDEKGVDMVMVSREPGIFNTANAWKIQSGSTVLDWLGQGWSVRVTLEPNANSKESSWGLQLTPIESGKVKNSRSLLLGNRIPKFKFCVIEGAYKPGKLKENPVHRRSIRKFKGKYTILMVWNADDTAYHKDSSFYHGISRSLGEDFQMIMLNHGGSGRYVYGYNKRFDTKMIQGFCSPKVTEVLKLQTMPQMFILDPKQHLIAMNLSPFELQAFINGTLR